MEMIIEAGNFEIDAEPYLREALEALPFITPKHHDYFCRCFCQDWDSGILVRKMFKAGLPDGFFTNTGDLTERDALAAIEHRAARNLYREMRRLQQNDILSGPLGHRYKEMRCSSDMGCPQGRMMHGDIVPTGKQCPFPLPDCPEMWCNCQWEFVSPWGKR